MKRKLMQLVQALSIALMFFAACWLCAWLSAKQGQEEQRRRQFITDCVFDGVPLVYCEQAFKIGERVYKPVHTPFSAR